MGGSQDVVDVVVVGGGIVGLATAAEIAGRDPGVRSVVLLEKEPALARHQSGRNSGVVHSGLYYRPGSTKARLCVDGARRMERFCREHDLPFAAVGKLVVATEERELAPLDELQRRGSENGVAGLERLDAGGLRSIEPHAAGIAALHVPGAAVVDYGRVAEALAGVARSRGVAIRTGAAVRSASRERGEWRVRTAAGELRARLLVSCAGLHADRVARACGAAPSVRIVPFRGEYLALAPEVRDLVRGLIYPVPDPRLPFLGVHFTRRVDGEVEVGPNAVPALAREGYSRADVSARDVADALAWPGSWRLALRHARAGAAEIARSLWRPAFVRALRRLVPAVRAEHLVPAPSGVRAQAVDRRGTLVDDFAIEVLDGAVHVLNAPSPAATASLAIAREIADRALAGGRRGPTKR